MDSDKISRLLGSSGRKVLLYHTDSDGISSAALILRFFGGFAAVPRDGPIIDDRFLHEIISMKPDLLVVLDIPIDQEWKKMEFLQQSLPGLRLVVIDHHIPEKNLTSRRSFHINPRFEREVYIPASALVYRLLQQMGKDVRPLIWIAGVGIVGDHAFEDCKDIVRECVESFPDLGGDIRKSKLNSISGMLTSAVVLHGTRGVMKSLEILLSTDRMEDLLKNEYLRKCDGLVSAEIKRVMSDFRKRAREFPNLDLIIYRLSSRLNIASTISTLLAEKHPDKMIFVTKQGKRHVKVSARYQAGKINLSKLLKSSVDGIGSGGGHEKAAGAVINKHDSKEFERRLVNRITELRAG
ncbi:MAG: DHH family phosphoesterase [Candidatus Aenigmarchaeota archaeon]|nr:DHH family phosphoesterase [Candidatus Aenigmarchaeota archaeon]